MARGPITDAERQRVIDLIGAGTARNEIARQVGISAGSVTNIAKAAGLSFDRTASAVAVEARKVDLASLRAELAHTLLVKAKDLIADLDKPFLAFNFGGKDNTYEEHELQRPPTGDIRNLMQSAGIAMQRSMDLSKFDADPNDGAAAVDAWLDAMGA